MNSSSKFVSNRRSLHNSECKTRNFLMQIIGTASGSRGEETPEKWRTGYFDSKSYCSWRFKALFQHIHRGAQRAWGESRKARRKASRRAEHRRTGGEHDSRASTIREASMGWASASISEHESRASASRRRSWREPQRRAWEQSIGEHGMSLRGEHEMSIGEHAREARREAREDMRRVRAVRE